MQGPKDYLQDSDDEQVDQYTERKKRAVKRERCKVTGRMIQFYRETDSYGCFSNFSKHSIVMEGVKWATVEHYFQGQKFAGLPMEQKIRNAEGPGAAKKLGQTRKVPIRGDWEQVKDQIMYDAVLAKFSQHDNIRVTLLKTGDAVLVEHTPNDSYWGDGGDGKGKNMLGKTLMLVREELRKRQEDNNNDGVATNTTTGTGETTHHDNQNNTNPTQNEEEGEEREEAEGKEASGGQAKNLRLTLQKNGIKKPVILPGERKLEDLEKIIKQKFRTKAKKITTYPDGQVVDQGLLSGLAQDSVLLVA